MPAHIDEPAPGMAFAPASFVVRGWVWLEDQHAALAAVEVWSGSLRLGTADFSSFYERPDVSAKYALPGAARTGFDFVARHPSAQPGDRFTLDLRPRLRDGTDLGPVFSSRIGPLPLERDPLALLRERVPPTALGVEIGAPKSATTGLRPYLAEQVELSIAGGDRGRFLAEAAALPLADATLDYLCSSHVLEHLPDPLAALYEWHRVLRPGGWLYLVVPDKRFTFDEPRAVTSCAHLFDDFLHAATTATSLEHVDEFIFQTNWSMLRPDGPATERTAQQAAARAKYQRDIEQGIPIDIHFHTFTPESLQALLRAGNFIEGATPLFELAANAERYPPGRDDGMGMLLRKTGEPSRAEAPLRTFALTHPTDAIIPPLPLVCPISRAALAIETNAIGERSLVSSDAHRRYAFGGSCPALLAPPGDKPIRPWSESAWRTARYAAGFFSAAPSAGNAVRAHLDEPVASSPVDPLCFFVRGWAWLGSAQPYVATIEAWAGDTIIGATNALYERVDVIAAHRLPLRSRTGFELFAHCSTATPGQPLEFQIRARLADDTRTPPFATATAKTIGRDYRQNHFGILLDQRTTATQRHGNIFAEGPSSVAGSAEVAALLRRYLGPPPRRILDVGCGLASYGHGLLADGYDWFGAEVDAADCAELARLGLPHRQVDGKTLPFADASFDTAMCIEVLEHIADPRAFLREVGRVAPRQLIVSVPNCELLGYLWDHLATPWHMLEADHKNFFTRWSLGALLREFYPQVELRFHTPYPLPTVEGTPLHYHLFAVGTKPA